MSDEPNGREPVRVQLSRARGWRMPPNTVKVSRPTVWGNPFVAVDGVVYANPLQVHFIVTVTNDAAKAYELWLRGELIQAEALAMYRNMRAEVLARFPELRGKNLACWCKPGEPCHADVLLRMANAR